MGVRVRITVWGQVKVAVTVRLRLRLWPGLWLGLGWEVDSDLG